MNSVKTISLHQPWASMLFARANGMILKMDETRGWPTDVRGRILIHAAKKPMCAEERDYFDEDAARCGTKLRACDLAFGVLIGSAFLAECRRTQDVRDIRTTDQLRWGDYEDGRFAWVLQDPVLFDRPIPYRGYQRWFNVPLAELESIGKLHLAMLRNSGNRIFDRTPTQEKLAMDRAF